MFGWRALDEKFEAAVAAIDAGDVPGLERLLAEEPRLVLERLTRPGKWLRSSVGRALNGFFKRPYLLWFVAEDPVRNGTLPDNIAQVADVIVRAARRAGAKSLQEQLDYALRLVALSWIARERGVQIGLIDVLADAGASLGESADGAVFNGNFDAAEHLLNRGAPITLSTALVLGRWDDVDRLAPAASMADKQSAMVVAALLGKTEALAKLLSLGLEPTTVSKDTYSHATVLHHAVCSGSFDAVKLLVEAGADVSVKDTAHHGTPLGWAEHYVGEQKPGERVKQYDEIAAYLRGVTR